MDDRPNPNIHRGWTLEGYASEFDYEKDVVGHPEIGPNRRSYSHNFASLMVLSAHSIIALETPFRPPIFHLADFDGNF